ncbi:hypothetical protein MMIN_08690 [Mycolicibacter minnesotensis]|nr:hypothetical protein MMIN_08690 [Mycolicibacter minnesotensis]
MLSALQAAADDSKGPAPGPADSDVECTSGGEAIQIGAVIADHRMPPEQGATWGFASSLGVHRPGSQDATM